MKHLKSYKELNEALIPGGWDPNWKESPEWETLQGMGFTDATTPIQARNQTIMISNETIPLYPAGIVLQKSGYIRDKGVTSGFIKNYNSKEENYSIKIMFDYIIDRYSKEIRRRTRSPKHGDLSDAAINYLANCIKTENWELNPETNRIDVKGSVSISSYNEEILQTIRFGVIKGNFIMRNISATNLNFAPTIVKGDFDCSYTDIESLEGCPERVNGNFSCRSCQNLTSLEGSPRHVGQNFDVSDCNSLNSLIGAPDYIGERVDVSMTAISSFEGLPEVFSEIRYFPNRADRYNANYSYLRWNPKGWIEGAKNYPEMFGPLLNDSNRIISATKRDILSIAKVYNFLKPQIKRELDNKLDINQKMIDSVLDINQMGLV